MDTDTFEPLPNQIRWIDRQIWLRDRRAETRRQLRALSTSIASLKRASQHRRPHGDVHLLVVPHDGPATGLWKPANGNITYEVYQSAVEILGADRVTFADIANDEDDTTWQSYLLDLLAQTGATHVIGQIERNPNKTVNWSWDVVVAALQRSWGGTMVGQMYDSGFQWLRLRAQRMARLFDNLLIADLAEPMTGYAVPGRYEVGPMTLPLSRQTLDLVAAHISGLPKAYDLTFIGALYDNRISTLEALRKHGLDLHVNPQRGDEMTTYEGSRTNRPSWLDYMAALAQSEMTINFALASAGPRYQYKIRVQEASIVGCLVLTDDVDRTSRFFAPDEYLYFDTLDSLERIVQEQLANPDQLRLSQQRARRRAEAIASTDYWGRIDDGLRRRGLPVITGLSTPRTSDATTR